MNQDKQNLGGMLLDAARDLHNVEERLHRAVESYPDDPVVNNPSMFNIPGVLTYLGASCRILDELAEAVSGEYPEAAE
ncbi:MAG: hypothetical protein SPI12_01695 [Actinomycetaceae bacterium]|nr:hypothetical protein [Actinomycetaceae bacterium]MDY6082561.1 hypothetical protein [Actinomycetaceae bacterium]